jgi:hypothetical protein
MAPSTGYAWGEPVAARTSLLGEIFTPAQAHALGMVRELVRAEDLLDRAVAIAGQTPEDCLEQYAFTKRACQAAALRDIADLADPLDTELPECRPASTPSTRTATTGSSSRAARPTGDPNRPDTTSSRDRSARGPAFRASARSGRCPMSTTSTSASAVVAVAEPMFTS